MPLSGHIGQAILFQEQNALSVTGVLVGTGEAQYQLINDEYVDVRIPNTASWGPLTFQRPDITETFEISGTGVWETGAFAALEGVFSAGGYGSYCASGEVTYANVHDASGVCDILTIGASEAEAISKLSDVHTSGLCGSEDEGFVAGSYQVSATRVGEASTSPDAGGTSWVAFSRIEDTGSFYHKKATTLLTCTLGNQDTQTPYSFVPFPVITSFAPNTGELGDLVGVYGYAFSGLVSAGLGSQAATIQNLSNDSFSLVVPAGDFDDSISITGQSGVSTSSLGRFRSPVISEAFSEAASSLAIDSNQLIKRAKGAVNTVNVASKGTENLTGAHLTNQQDFVHNIFNSSLFDYSDVHVTVPVTGLDEGIYSLTAQTSSESVTASNTIYILDVPSFSYSSGPLWSSGVGNLELYDDQAGWELHTVKDFGFDLTVEADELCLNFLYQNITGGSVNYALKRYAGNAPALSPYYTAIGYGSTQQIATLNAYNNYNNGSFASDAYGDPVSVDITLCSITSSGTGTHAESNEFTVSGLFTGEFYPSMYEDPFITGLRSGAFDLYDDYETVLNCSTGEFVISSGFLSAADFISGTEISTTGLTALEATTEADSIISSSYTGYTITGRTSGTSEEDDSFAYSSGIDFPFNYSTAHDYGSQPWVNIWASGMDELFPNGNTGGYTITSGFDIVTGAPTGQGALTESGKDLTEAYGSLKSLLDNFYWACATGVVSSFTTGETIYPSYTGYFFGYCSGGGVYRS